MPTGLGSEREDFRISGFFCTEKLYHGVGIVHLAGGERGDIYGSSECFSCSWISKSTASCGMDTSRTEVSVLGRERVNVPLGFLICCLLTETVLL